MERSRAARRERVRSHRKQMVVWVAAGAAAAVLVGAAVVAPRMFAGGTAGKRKPRAAEEASEAALVVPVAQATTETPVEVPNVTGRTLTEAELVLQTAGFVVVLKGDTMTADGRPAKVTAQSPPPGTRLAQGQQVSITLAPADKAPAKRLLVVVDPGHQAKADTSPEPVGPGAAEMQQRATAGACGVATKRQECEVALEVALLLKARLEGSGIQVLMTRTTSAVNLSNVQRAEIANKAGADLFVRIHADAAASAGVRGVSVMYPDGNAWVAPIAGASKRAAGAVGAATARATGAPDGGIAARSDLAGFNWSKVPAILVETGYLSNADDDKLLGNPGYQDKLAAGIVNGILTYFGR